MSLVVHINLHDFLRVTVSFFHYKELQVLSQRDTLFVSDGFADSQLQFFPASS